MFGFFTPLSYHRQARFRQVEAEIQAIEDLRVDLEGMRAAAKTTVQHIPDEAEKRPAALEGLLDWL